MILSFPKGSPTSQWKKANQEAFTLKQLHFLLRLFLHSSHLQRIQVYLGQATVKTQTASLGPVSPFNVLTPDMLDFPKQALTLLPRITIEPIPFQVQQLL